MCRIERRLMPECALEYADLPPMPGSSIIPIPMDAPSAAPATPAAPVEEDEPESADAAAPEPTDASPDDADAQTADAPDEDDAPDDVKSLRAQMAELQDRLQQAEAYEQWYADQQRASQQQYAEAYWQNAETQAESWFSQRAQQIYLEAEEAIAPVAYIQQQMEMLTQQRDTWYRQFYGAREQAYWQLAMREALPNYAREVATHYGLGQEAISELLTYPAELMPREAERMKRDRDRLASERRKATQAARKAKQQETAQTFTGDGRVASGKIVPGSDDHYNSIAWTRGR